MPELKKIFNSQLNRRIVAFFHNYPTTVDTAGGISAWLNQNIDEVRAALKYLAEQNILIAHQGPPTTAYGYTQDLELIEQIARLIAKE
ncbi:MAG: hypothetical protein JW714_02120 [Candidatus Omnitrophica bacterium]|nr:hypothetical protein [Candidatus Omnitrophota bacterium]